MPKQEVGYLYAISWDIPDYECPIKVGMSASVQSRIDDISTGSPSPVIVHGVWELPYGNLRDSERMIHSHLREHRVKNEWFERTVALRFLEEYMVKFKRVEFQQRALPVNTINSVDHMTKKEVAEYLRVSERAVNRYAAAGQLTVVYEPLPGGSKRAHYDRREVENLGNARQAAFNTYIGRRQEAKLGHYDPAEVEQLQATRTVNFNFEKTIAREKTQKQKVKLERASPRALAIRPAADAVVGVLAAAIERALHATPQKAMLSPDRMLTLSLSDASALAGLSKNFLREAIRKKKLKAAKRGRGWNIKRTDLEKWVSSL